MSDVYIPEADITAVGADGLTRLVAAQGVPIPMAEAKALGLVKDEQTAGPSETKTDERAEKKTAKK